MARTMTALRTLMKKEGRTLPTARNYERENEERKDKTDVCKMAQEKLSKTSFGFT